MIQSTLHVGIIMDGNGRWATRRNLPRWVGHQRGAAAVRRVVEASPDLGIGTLTLYAFSSDNWRRPPDEVAAIFRLMREFLDSEVNTCVREGIRLNVIGRRDRLGDDLAARVADAERTTATGRRLHLRLAVDYSSRDMMLRAAEACSRNSSWSRQSFSEALGSPDVDLIIRTAGEKRLSDFLLWECAYAEFEFLDVLWPDMDRWHLEGALASFRQRDRRYGGLTQNALQPEPVAR